MRSRSRWRSGPTIRSPQYRHAKLLLAQKQEDDALVVFAGIHKRHEETPPTIYAAPASTPRACTSASASRQIAIDLYRTATTVFGGDRRAKDAARQHSRASRVGSLIDRDPHRARECARALDRAT